MTGKTLEKDELCQLFSSFAVEIQKQIAEELEPTKRRIIVLAGPTGCGKSAFALQLAKMLKGEIVLADSMQIYKGMDIGTAKPTVKDRLEVPHHLVDIREIKDHFNVVDFYYDITQSCKAILACGAVPIVVGGSGFYLHTFLYGPPSGPPPIPELREKLEQEAEEKGVDVLYERLRLIDPHYARTITKNDRQKIIRALEIIEGTGKKVSKLSWNTGKMPRYFNFRCWFLHRPKDKLYRRIEARCEQMIADGLIDETERLDQLGLRQNSSAAQAIGYKQVLAYLDSQRGEKEYQHLIEEFKKVSRNYAKRQFTWFRKENQFRWLDLDMHDPEVALEMVIQDYLTS